MATPNTLLISPTSLPRFDTLAHDTRRAHTTESRQLRTYERRQFSYAGNPAAQPKGKSSLLHSFSSFIRKFTGETEVCFQYAQRTTLDASPRPETVEAIIAPSGHDSSASSEDVVLDHKESPETNEDFGFGLEILADPDNFDSISTLPVLHHPFVVQYHATLMTLVLFYDPECLPEDFASVAWNVLCRRISRDAEDENDVRNSVLNHPPLRSPPPLSQVECDGTGSSLLHAGFQRTAAKYPGRNALHFCNSFSDPESADESLTYAELDNLTTCLALDLRSRIKTHNESIIIPAYMSNSVAFYTSWLAVLKAGFAFCPLPVDAPSEQLSGIVEEVGAQLVLTNGKSAGGGRPWDAWYCDDDELTDCLDVDDFVRKWRTQAKNTPGQLPAIQDHDLAYVMYTSGSTGKPKGVRIHHFAAACSIASHAKFIPTGFVKDGFRWFQFAAPTFDPSIMEIFTTWWTGGTLCGAPRDSLLTDPEAVINRAGANIMMATPSMASVVRPEKVPTLRHLWTMGEKLTPKVIQNFASNSPSNDFGSSHVPSLQRPRKLLNAYGPTEGSINCTIVPDVSADERGSVIGQPIDTCSILIIDPDRREPTPVPLGFSGELVIGGPQVSQGYLNRPEQTAAAFATSSEYGRLYRTGDRARIVRTKNGKLTVDYLGRMTSDQVKLSGRRVELGQIESTIAHVAGVSNAVAIVHQHGAAGQGSEQIVVCVTSDGSQPQEEILAACRKAAETSLAAFMRPSRYFVLDSLPRSRSGKTERRALGPIVDDLWETAVVSATSSDSGYDSGLARSMAEDPSAKVIIQAIADVCDVTSGQIALGTPLLSLGLDSLRAVRLLQQLREKGIANLNVASVLSSHTVQGLIQHCVSDDMASGQKPSISDDQLSQKLDDFSSRHLNPAARHLGIPASNIKRLLPTTATQSGMIASFLRSTSSSKESAAKKRYINHSIYYAGPQVDKSKLENAWSQTLSRHDVLRTVFVPVDDEMAPFAQCALANSVSPTVQRHSCTSDDAWQQDLANARVQAEESISLEQAPFVISYIESPTQVAYMLSLFHGIFDGGSLELILQDVESIYHSQEPLARNDVGVAVRKHFSEATADTARYWQAKFEEFELAPFPCVSASKPETQSPEAQVTEVIGNTTLQRISEASKQMSVTPLSLLQAAWATILQAYTGSNAEVSFGSVLSNRLEEGLSSCMGPTFVVVPCKLSQGDIAQQNVQDVLKALTSRNAEDLPYHHIPLSSLVTAEGTLPYDTLLAFQAFDQTAGQGDLWSKVEYPAMEHDFAVMIEIWPTETGLLRLRATYTHEHLDRLAAETMLKQLDSVIGFLCEHPDRAFQDARFELDEDPTSAIPVTQTTGGDGSDGSLLLHHKFRQHVSQRPDHSALLFKQSLDGSIPEIGWTFAELHQLASTLAANLVAQFGSLQNEPIMLCMEKCPELYVCVLGVLLAGAGWCPIDPYSPPARQHAIIERTGSRALLLSATASNLDQAAVPEGVQTFQVNLNELQSQAIEAPTIDHKPSDLAYLIFTSGTTGLPKGVPITHESAATAMNALAEAVPSDVTGGEVRCMQFSQHTFDVFVQDLFYTWTLGGTVISSNRQIMIQNFAELANETKATHAHLTPAFSATLSRDKIKTLEVVTMIGEKLTEAVALDWGTNMRAYNTYGPAEVTVVSTLRQFTGKSDHYHASNIGVPLPSVGTYVVDNGKVVMRGAIGELALAGPQLSPGYWNMPEVNAKKFIWDEKLQQKLYLTGDLVRHLADGTINFVGRNDDLVKLGGIRIELSEIAFALRNADPRIEKFEVLHLQRKGAQEKFLVAFMACPSVADADGEVKALLTPGAKKMADLAREYGQKVLPPYMLPTTFIVLPRIPRTASAKVDRVALTNIYHGLDLATWGRSGDDSDRSELGDKDSQWRQQNEKVLQVIADGLRVRVSSLHRNSSLPAIGIDSIGAIRLIPKINNLGFKLSVVDAFKCRTLGDLCDLTEASATPQKSEDNGSSQSAEQTLQRLDATYYKSVSEHLGEDEITVISTTVLQESLLSESFKDAQAYWSSHLSELDANIDLGRLKKAWTKVARQTDALRAGFVAKAAVAAESDDSLSYLQIIYDEPQFEWRENDLASLIEDAAKQRVSEIAEHHHKQLFKLPPWGVDIFKSESGAVVMMVTIHHTIYDGPSLDFLMADVQAAYSRTAKSSPRLSMRDAIAGRSALEADSDESVIFWRNALQDSSSDTSEDSAIAQHDGQLKHRVQHFKSTTPIDDLRKLAVEQGLSSLVTVYRTAWALVLKDLLESPQVMFAEILSERTVDSKMADVIGPMMSTVPCLFRAGQTVAETLKEHDKFSKQAWKHRNVRPGTIKSFLGRESGSQIYPAVFAFHPATGDDEANSSALWKRLPDVTNIQVEHPFAFNVWQDSVDCPSFELAVPEHLMKADEQDLLMRQIDAIVAAMIANADVPTHGLTDGLETKLISKTTPRKDTCCPPSHGPTYWVEHWAETQPSWKAAEIALKIDLDGTETESWTFAEVDREANRIANWILNAGISKRMIGMCLGRTLNSYAVILGILKSGNTYLPIDDSLPAERKSFLLEDSDSAFVFTTQALFADVEVPESCRLIDVDSAEHTQEIASMSSEKPDIHADARDNAYLLYTSGSTGKPKGVLVNRENLASFVEAQCEFIFDVSTTKDTAGKGNYLGLASRAFDVHLAEMFLAWRFGCAAVTAPRSMLLDDLALALESLHITHFSSVPSLLDQTGLAPEDAPDLIYISTGGEKMSQKTKKLWGSHDRVALINAYGPTEATIGCCSGPVFPETDTQDIGSPLGDSQAHVLVPGTDHYALRGMPGELCFTGSLIANGYLNRPDAKGFVEDFHGVRMYRTGDIVRLGLDDHIYFIGRKDDQVKIRGQRVELGEVAEGVRTASPAEIDATALVLQHPGLARKQLVAFIAPAKSKSRDAPEVVQSELQDTNSKLRAQCQKSLPSMLVPDLIVPLTYIPLAATSGKADNKLLTKIFNEVPMNDLMPGQSGGATQAVNNRPLNDAEREVWSIISPVLKEQPKSITPDSSLFQLGIDSLSGISVFSKLRAAGYESSVSMVMKNPTLAELALSPRRRTVDDAKRSSEVREKLAAVEKQYLQKDELQIDRAKIAAIRPCLPLQEVLIAQSMHQGSSGLDGAYVNHIKFRLSDEIDVDRLRQVWSTLIRKNDILRTCFSTSEDKFLQVVLKNDVSDDVWKRKTLPGGQSIERFQEQVASQIVQDLQSHPPMRLHLLRVEDGPDVLLLSIHHAIYDGNSLEMMFRDVQHLYDNGTSEDRPNVIPLLEHIAAQDETRLQAHWSNLLQCWESAPLLSDKSTRSTSLHEAERQFTKSVSELESVAGSLQVTVATMLQAAFAVAMSQKLNTNDFIFGNVLSGRTIPVPDADKIMAPCITTIPQRARFVDHETTFANFLESLQKSNSSSLEFQHVSPRDIQRWMKADRALYDTLFSFIRVQGKSDVESPLLSPESSDIRVDYPLAVEVTADSGSDRLTIRAGFTETFGSASDANTLLEKIELLIDSITQQKDLTVGMLGIPLSGQASRTSRPEYDEQSWSSDEQRIRTLISEYTSIPEKDIHKDTAFIHLGIDSISAIRFAKSLRKEGYNLSSADIIRHNRIGALGEYLKSMSESESAPKDAAEGESSQSSNLLAALQAENVPGLDDAAEYYECTPLQAGMLAQSLATDGALYMHHHAVHLTDGTDVDRLKASWDALVNGMDVLRTTFHWLPQQKTPWIAVVHKDRKPSWREVNAPDARQYWLSLSDESDFVERVENAQPLAKVDIVRSEESTVLILSLHHAIYDGISLGMLYKHLEMRYAGEASPPTTPFFQAAKTTTANAKPAVKYWSDLLNGYQGTPNSETEEGVSFQLLERSVAADMSALEAQARAADMDIKDACIAAFGKALACMHQRRDIVFGQVMAARHSNIGDGNDVLGPMFNTVPFRVAIKDSLMTNRALIQAVHEVSAGSIEYQHAPLAEVQKAWRASASNASAQLLDSIFVYSKVDSQESKSKIFGEPLEADKSPVPSEYKLNFEVEHSKDGIFARALTSVSHAKAETLLDHFSDALLDFVQQPERFATAFPAQLRTLPTEIHIPTTAAEHFDDDAVSRFSPVIRKAMAEVAQVSEDKIGLDSSIYTFGIDSIAAIQIVSRCKKDGVRLSVADILKGAMLGRICEIVAEKQGRQSKTSMDQKTELVSAKGKSAALQILDLPEKDVEEVLPCLPGQEYHLFSWLQSGRTLYEPGWCYQSTTRLDNDRLKTAWQTVRKRNAVLRTTFAAADAKRALQVIVKSEATTDDAFDIVEAMEMDVLEAVKARAHLEARLPSDFFKIPVRLRLVHAKDGDAIMLYVHHSLYDAWSMPRLVTELQSIYQDQNVEDAPAFSELVRSTITSTNKQEEQQFWSESFSGCEKAIVLSQSQPKDDLDRSQSFYLTEGTQISVAKLEEVCASHNISPHHLVLLAFAKALAIVTETNSPIFGFFQLGRSAAFDGIEKVTGPCVNALPLGLKSVLQRDIKASIKALQQTLGSRVPFEQSSLRTAVEAFDPSRTQLPFNAYVNLLWNKTSLIGQANKDDLFQPMKLGVPTDYSSPEAMPGRTAVDALDVSFLPPQQIFVDVGPGEKGIVFGARADKALMGVERIKEFVGRIEGQVVECVELLQR